MKKTKIFAFLLSLLLLVPSIPVQAAEFVEIEVNIHNQAIIPRALITATNVYKWSESGNFKIRADIVTNDGTGKIIDIKNIYLDMYTSNIQEISLSNGEIWEGGSYATVTITYRYNGKIYSDIAKFYPYGN